MLTINNYIFCLSKSLCSPFQLYDLNVPEYDEEYALLLLKNITEDFMIQNPEFIGTKVIFCGGRYQNETKLSFSFSLILKEK